MTEKIYILLPVHNRRDVTRKFIECLKEQTFSNYHLVLIDDGSTDGTANMVKDLIPDVTVLRGIGNWWWAGCLQRGIEWLQQNSVLACDIVLIINDDVIFNRYYLDNAINELANSSNTLFLSQQYESNSQLPTETGIEVDWRMFSFEIAKTPERINCLSTRGLFMKWRELCIIGGFYPKILPHYWADYEFTIRAAKRGIRLATSPKLLVQDTSFASNRINFDGITLVSFIKLIFSNKTSWNPIHQIVFLILSCPWKWITINFLRVIKGFSVLVVRQIRYSIKLRTNKTLLYFQVHFRRAELKVVLGAGNTRYSGWISTDFPTIDVTNSKSLLRYFNHETIKSFVAEHVWEHLTLEQSVMAMKNCFEFLKPGGYLRIGVPDGYHPDEEYIEQVKPGGSGAGANDHKILFNYKLLSELLESCGFIVKLLEYFDENGVFHYSAWSAADGFIARSSRFDKRNRDRLVYTSLIIDAIRPE
jgi:predicted SAM-dependent methyltransferase/GT2 family glycosyltransferase